MAEAQWKSCWAGSRQNWAPSNILISLNLLLKNEPPLMESHTTSRDFVSYPKLSHILYIYVMPYQAVLDLTLLIVVVKFDCTVHIMVVGTRRGLDKNSMKLMITMLFTYADNTVFFENLNFQLNPIASLSHMQENLYLHYDKFTTSLNSVRFPSTAVTSLVPSRSDSMQFSLGMTRQDEKQLWMWLIW